MSNVIRLGEQMAKPELIAHLERSHSRAITQPIDSRAWTKQQLQEVHRIIHIGVGGAADHVHRTPPWVES